MNAGTVCQLKLEDYDNAKCSKLCSYVYVTGPVKINHLSTNYT